MSAAVEVVLLAIGVFLIAVGGGVTVGIARGLRQPSRRRFPDGRCPFHYRGDSWLHCLRPVGHPDACLASGRGESISAPKEMGWLPFAREDTRP